MEQVKVVVGKNDFYIHQFPLHIEADRATVPEVTWYACALI